MAGLFALPPFPPPPAITFTIFLMLRESGALVQWLKLPAWKVGDRGFIPCSGLKVSKKQTVSSPLTRKDSILTMTER